MADDSLNPQRENDEQSLRRSISLTATLIEALKSKSEIEKRSKAELTESLNVVRELNKVYDQIKDSVSKRYTAELSSKQLTEQLNKLKEKENAISKSSLADLAEKAKKDNDSLNRQKTNLQNQVKELNNAKENLKFLEAEKHAWAAIRRSSPGGVLSKEDREGYDRTTKEIDEEQATIKKYTDLRVQQNLASVLKQVGLNKTLTTEYKTALDQIAKQKAELEAVRDLTKKVETNVAGVVLGFEAADGILKKLGAGKLSEVLKIGETLSKLKTEMFDLEKKGDGMSKFEQMSFVFKEMGPNIAKALGPLAIILFIIDKTIEAFKILDKGTTELARNLGISRDESEKMFGSFEGMANRTGDIFITANKIAEAVGSIAQSMGVSFNNTSLQNEALKDNLVGFTKLSEKAKINKDTLLEIFKYSQLTGKSSETQTKEFLGQAALLGAQKGLHLNNKQLLDAQTKTSEAIKLSLGLSQERIAAAVVSAKALGVELNKVEGIADSLLNFESSIQAELEAELLTNKELNLEKARQAALNNDLATVAEEVAKNVGSANQFAKMNRVQQEAIAKAVGMQREELAKALIEKEAISKLGATDAKDAMTKFNQMVKEHDLQYAKNQLQDDNLAALYEQMSVQERLNAISEKFTMMFLPMAEAVMVVLEPMMDLVGLLFKGMSYAAKFGEWITDISTPLTNVGKILRGIADVALLWATYSLAALGFSTGGLGIPLAIAAIAAGAGAIATLGGMKADDYEDPGYGKRKIVSPEGVVHLNDNDSIFAGTKSNFRKNQQSPQITTNVDISPVTTELIDLRKDMNALMKTLINKEGGVYLDGHKVGNTLALGTYKTQ